MDAALIINGVVKQVWREHSPRDVEGLVSFPNGQVCAGMLWDGANLTNPTPSPILHIVTRLQFRKMLRTTNRVAAFLTYVNGANAEIKDYWELSDQFQRLDAEIDALRDGLGLTDAQMDAAFTQARTL